MTCCVRAWAPQAGISLNEGSDIKRDRFDSAPATPEPDLDQRTNTQNCLASLLYEVIRLLATKLRDTDGHDRTARA